MPGETNPAILPPIVHRSGASPAEDFSVRLLAPWSSRGWALRPSRAERITYEPVEPAPTPAYDDAPLEMEPVAMDLDPVLELETQTAGSFPWEGTGRGQETSVDTLSPWESYGRALKESVTWDGISVDEPAAPEPDPWGASAEPVWSPPAAQSEPAPKDDTESSLEDIARRMEAFAAELRRVGYPAVTRALSGHRLEAAMASLVAGYVAASRTD
jgi:hypothetical protein